MHLYYYLDFFTIYKIPNYIYNVKNIIILLTYFIPNINDWNINLDIFILFIKKLKQITSMKQAK